MGLFESKASIAQKMEAAESLRQSQMEALNRAAQMFTNQNGIWHANQMGTGLANAAGGQGGAGASNYMTGQAHMFPVTEAKSNLIANVSIKKATNGFIVEAHGETYICATLEDVGAQIIGHIVAKRLEQ